MRRFQSMLLERERELAEIDAALGEVRAGRGCAVAIEAGAGLGKTRLGQETRELAAGAGLNVLSARATELERDFPFALVRQLFESRLAGLSTDERKAVLEGAAAARGALGLDPEGGGHDAFAVLHGLYWVTAALAERGPLLLAVDDAHIADAASLDYLRFLLPRLEELPVLLLVACRPDEPDPSGGLGQILADHSIRHLSPAPLSAEATFALLAQELDQQPDSAFAVACHELTGGNPFLLCELARTLVQEGIEPVATAVERVRGLAPERVTRTVLARIGQLPLEAGGIARALAVLGDGSDIRLVAGLADLDPDHARRAADELRASAILDPGASLRFIHPLVRNAVYVDVPAGERARAHNRAASLLRDQGAGPEQVATQLVVAEARGERATVETLLEAGERSLAGGAPRSAIAFLTRALQEPPPAELRAEVLEPLVTATYRAVDHASFAAIEEDVFAEMERNPSLRSGWAIPLTMALTLGGRFDEAASILVEAADIAVTAGDVERAFELEAQLHNLRMLVPSVPEIDLTRYAGRIDPESPAGRLAASMEARTAVVDGTATEAAEAAKRALGSNGAIFAEESELSASVVTVMTLVAADELVVARQAAERALAIASARDATPELVRAWFVSGFVAWGEGDLVTAEADMRQAIDLARLAGLGPLVLAISGSFVEILIERDLLEEADAELQAAGVASGPMPENSLFGMYLLMRIHLRFERSEFDQAVEDFDTLVSWEERLSLGPGPLATASPWVAASLVAVGERERAREIADGYMGYVRRWGTAAPIAHVLRGVAVAAGGAEEIELLGEAAAMMESSPRRLQHAHVLVDLGAALRRAGRRAEARVPLREGLALARRCGAERTAKRAHAELEATGEKVRRYAPIGVESLTPSERRVAELAASGMSNRQIAQFLFVTVKTVEAHLSAAYDKLDIESRRQLGEALGDRTNDGLAPGGPAA